MANRMEIAAYSKPINGEALFSDPNSAWRKPPKHSSIKDSCKEIYKILHSGKINTAVIKAAMAGVSVEDITKAILIMAISKGVISLLNYPNLTEPTMILVWYVCKQVGITPRFFDTENSELTEKELKYFRGL